MRSVFSLLISFLCLVTHNAAFAAPKSKVCKSPVKVAMVFDVSSGKVLYGKNTKVKAHPASTLKLMTIYLAFEKLAKGELRADQNIVVSKHASKAEPCKLHLKPGDRITVQKAIEAIIIKSANDAARAMAEKIAGSESKFAALMNKKARALGMHDTHFYNASGLHHPKQQTTAADLVKLTIALRKRFPQYCKYFSKTSFEFNGKTYVGHNTVARDYPHARLGKTGYISASGFNLVTLAEKNNKHLIGVIMGEKNARTRDQKMMTMLDKYFDGPTKITASN